MKYLSVCSGIEAATVAWHPLGWRPVAFAEVDKFPCAVLAHHYPTVPNWGDMTKFHEWPNAAIDVLVGGTPCQSFSVAGLRKGLDDPRGNLTLTFLAIADKYKPQWIVWENVPGILSDKTGALMRFLDGLEEIGYVIDIDILDAQFFGVPQRRRRLFVCAQRANTILQAKTITSALTIIQCLAESLRLTLIDLLDQSNQELENCGLGDSKSGNLLKKRMRLFDLDLEGAALKLEQSLAVLQQSLGQEQNALDSVHGNVNCETFEDTRLRGLTEQEGFLNTDKLLRVTLEEALTVMRECIISTSEKEITESRIFICARTLLRIARLITPSTSSSPSFWSAASSNLIAMREFTNYARSAVSDIFTGMEWIQPWSDFVREADDVCKSLGNLGVTSFGKIFPISNSLSGHPAPGREAGQDTAVSTGDGIARCLTTGESKRQDWETCNFVTHTLRGEGFDANEDGTGRGTPLVASGSVVRRLTPRECERLQGFPDDYTAISWRGKPADQCPDGPRYKALGNSMAVPVMRWIGERINIVDSIKVLSEVAA